MIEDRPTETIRARNSHGDFTGAGVRVLPCPADQGDWRGRAAPWPEGAILDDIEAAGQEDECA